MPKDSDPFKHLPELRDKIIEPMKSDFRTFEIAMVDDMMREAGAPEDWRHSDAEREKSRRETLRRHGEGDLWVFAYGSLVWDPAFRFCEVRTGLLKGYHRSFCLKSELGRGTPEQPGLMAGLDVGGECIGLVFRIADELVDHESQFIWRREMLLHAYAPTFVRVETPLGEVTALGFVVDHTSAMYLPGMSLEETARHLATGVGFLGSNLAYIENLVENLEAVGIVDGPLFQLRDLSRQLAIG